MHLFLLFQTDGKNGFVHFLGMLLIHLLNVTRIALLTYALYYYPNQEELLHGTIFSIIYIWCCFLFCGFMDNQIFGLC